ncbi:hypothetical protein FSP39_009395 [Pinctada imbricata]|uniref:F-box only protein 9 n=1 Tax=Pinctada imbricata TaxID=66713 RepID=A0AA89BYT4_PINIB|nr:hypothetical protein FSP39_009395 [Pinctada imbricata]
MAQVILMAIEITFQVITLDQDNDPVVPPLIDDESESDTDPPDIEKELSDFRTQWKQELETEAREFQALKANKELEDEATILEKAKILFIKGSQCEEAGDLYEAVEYYRKATQLVPDIEFRIDLSSTRSPRDRTESASSVGSIELDENLEDLIEHFQKIQIEENIKTACLPRFEQRAVHISALPVEILLYIFKWVVSPDLDIKSLENLSEVCRGFYLAARDEEIWRLACLRVWGVSTGKSRKYGGWRNMYTQRPHLHFNGCYISKTTYIRNGEHSLDGFYRPFHIVEYYRYARFFPEGIVYVITNSDDPLQTLPKLNSRHFKYQGMLKGMYKVTGDRVLCVMKRYSTNTTKQYYRHRNRIQPDDNDKETTFNMEFELQNSGQRSHAKLQWLQYTISNLYKSSGDETHSDMLDSKKNFPPLIFSRVKSYTALSEAPIT